MWVDASKWDLMCNRICCGSGEGVFRNVTSEGRGHKLLSSSYIQKAFSNDVLTISFKEIFSQRELRER